MSSYKLGTVRLNLLETSNGVELRVTSEIPAVVSRIKGLGFFGLMASQDNHREHHFTRTPARRCKHVRFCTWLRGCLPAGATVVCLKRYEGWVWG